MEVVPEFTADVGIKKGEKVDYAIKKDNKIIMLFECKHCGGDLSLAHASQLFRYFSVTEARIAVLTNGIVYRFFTDLEAANKMDEKPFLEINMLELNDVAAAELKKLSQPAFNLDELMTAAGELKYTREVKCLVPQCDGVVCIPLPAKEALWDRFYMAAPARLRHCVERYSIVKKA
jgi:hypothetical protein